MVASKSSYRYTVEKYDRMIEAGILTKSDRVELIRGEIVSKMPLGDQHVATVNRLTFALTSRFHGRALLQIQCPIRLSDSEPEPDASVVEFRPDFYASGKATPANVLLLIEVAESSLEIDRDVKATLYAENGVREYWIVNLNDRQIKVFRQPQANGTYLDRSIRRLGDQIDLLAFPGVMIPVDDLLP
jgi:Uma2 family endonuclease